MRIVASPWITFNVVIQGMLKDQTAIIMEFLFIVLVVFIPITSSIEVLVERGERGSYDKILWHGDCSKINGMPLTIGKEKMCICVMRIKMNNITTELYGTLYPDDDEFVKCSYYFRKTGEFENSVWLKHGVIMILIL